MRRAVVLGLCFMLFTLQPTLGGAAVITDTFSHAGITVDSTSTEFYDYTAGATTSWTDTADFDAGTYTTTNSVEVTGSVVLDRVGPDGVTAPDPAISWWDTDWTNRRCYQIDHTATGASTVSEYQIRVPFPVETFVSDGFVQPDLGDLRAIGTDGSTVVPLWVDNTEPDVLWIRVDQIAAAATSHVCVYFGYTPGGAISPPVYTESGVFSYTTAKDIYYTVSDVYTTPGAAVNVVSYIDGNTASLDGAPPVALATAGDLATFDAVDLTPGSVISVLGPIGAAGIGDGADSLVPISFAGTSFVIPISRDGQQLSFIAPFGDATVDLYDGTALVNTFTVTAGTPYTHTADDISPGNAAIVESDVPVLVTHRSDTGGDAVAVYPAAAGDFYAVRSTEVVIGYQVDGTTVDSSASDGSVAATVGNRGTTTAVGPGGTQGGTPADGLAVTANQPVGIVGSEDGDGGDSVVVLPSSELSSEYWIPADSQYVAFSCPTAESADVPLTITPPGSADRSVTCSGGPDVAWALDTADLTVATRGISVSSDNDVPFAAYYEDSATDDQIGLLGPKQARQYTWPEPVVTPGGDEGLFETAGAWESQTIDVGAGNEIFGHVRISGSAPTDTGLDVQVATASSGTPTDYVGPDGTAATFFTLDSLPAVADFGHDGDRLVRVRVGLQTADPTATPQLDSVGIDSGLPELDRSLNGVPTIALPTTVDPTVSTSFLLRVKTTDPDLTGSEATVVYRGADNLANLAEETIRFVNESLGIDSVQQSVTLPVDAPLLFQIDHPYSLVLDHAAAGTGTSTVVFAWQLDYQGIHSIYLETDFAVEVTAP